ncbi:MAG TPA: hypothetical protein VFM24_03100 [Nitrospira sp.]|nr:hypothetical protein [Nitrospira sp.]
MGTDRCRSGLLRSPAKRKTIRKMKGGHVSDPEEKKDEKGK